MLVLSVIWAIKNEWDKGKEGWFLAKKHISKNSMISLTSLGIRTHKGISYDFRSSRMNGEGLSIGRNT